MPFNYSIVQYETSNMNLMLKLKLRNYIEQECVITFPKQRQLESLAVYAAVFSHGWEKDKKTSKHQKSYKHTIFKK